jgi:RNA polymerase sigma-70 factor (ECF subfamily)
VGADSTQIEALYRDRYLAFRNVIATITGSHDGARDVVQDAFTQAFARRATFRGEGTLEAWVWRIAVRMAIAARRHRPLLDSSSALDPMFLEPERDRELDAAIRALPPKRRLIVFLRYFADLSYSEIAEVCAISEGTVAATLTKARSELLAALDREGVST